MMNEKENLNDIIINLGSVENELNIDEVGLRLKYQRILKPNGEKSDKFLLFYKYINEENKHDKTNNYFIESTILSENYNILRFENLNNKIKYNLNEQNISFTEKNETYCKTDIEKKFILNDFKLENSDTKEDIIFMLLTNLKSNINYYYNILLNLSNSYNGKSTFDIQYFLILRTDESEFFENKFINIDSNNSNIHKSSLKFKIPNIINIQKEFENIIYKFKNIHVTNENIKKLQNKYLNKEEFEKINNYFNMIDDNMKNLYNLTLLFSQLKNNKNNNWVGRINSYIRSTFRI